MKNGRVVTFMHGYPRNLTYRRNSSAYGRTERRNVNDVVGADRKCSAEVKSRNTAGVNRDLLAVYIHFVISGDGLLVIKNRFGVMVYKF